MWLAMVLFRSSKSWYKVKEDIKYYFADFVRKGGTPALYRQNCCREIFTDLGDAPLYGQNFRQKGVTDLGGTPPLYGQNPQRSI